MTTKELLLLAYHEALKSPDTSTQNGAILLTEFDMVMDCNRLPDGIQITEERLKRPEKYLWTEHSERNVIFKAAKMGIKTNGATMICPWAACSNCSRAIIQAGVKKLITHKQAHIRSPVFWQGEIAVAMEMFKEAGIEVEWYDGVVGAEEILHCGEKWRP